MALCFVNTKLLIFSPRTNKLINGCLFSASSIYVYVCAFVTVYACVDGGEVDMQYSNWQSGHPLTTYNCVAATRNNNWSSTSCDLPKKVVCQS